MKSLGVGLCVAFFAACIGCSNADQERAQRDAETAKAKAQETAREAARETRALGKEAKGEAKNLDNKIDHALNGPSGSSGGSDSAEAKLDGAGETARDASQRAGLKLDHAALIAKVKSKLAADAGLSTVTGVQVYASGQVVTLSGSVSSPEQKRAAEAAASQVEGVSKVINNLEVNR